MTQCKNSNLKLNIVCGGTVLALMALGLIATYYHDKATKNDTKTFVADTIQNATSIQLTHTR
jgi:hypothetical protein